jgi:putative endonuclease
MVHSGRAQWIPARPEFSGRAGSIWLRLKVISRMLCTAYVLIDNKGRLYKGVSNCFVRRFLEHVSGKTKTTKSMQGLRLAYKEEHESFAEARRREKYFKTGAGSRFLKKVLQVEMSL